MLERNDSAAGSGDRCVADGIRRGQWLRFENEIKLTGAIITLPHIKAFAERAVKWDLDTNVRREMAYNHYFAKKPAPAAPAPTKKS